MGIDAKIVTQAEMKNLTAEGLRPLMVSLVNAYQESKDPKTQIGDISRLQLRTAFYDKAWGPDKTILPCSHAEYLEELKDGKPTTRTSPAATPVATP